MTGVNGRVNIADVTGNGERFMKYDILGFVGALWSSREPPLGAGTA